jgi:hypothetical protein
MLRIPSPFLRKTPTLDTIPIVVLLHPKAHDNIIAGRLALPDNPHRREKEKVIQTHIWRTQDLSVVPLRYTQTINRPVPPDTEPSRHTPANPQLGLGSMLHPFTFEVVYFVRDYSMRCQAFELS